MLKMNVHAIFRLLLGAGVAIALAAAPSLAQAQTPGSLTQLSSPNNCIEVTGDDSGEANECQTTGPGLNGSEDAVVSPDGKNVYVASTTDDAIAEFARNTDGSLTQIGCIADTDADGTTCSDATATGLEDPQAIAISPDGNNVYVAASTSDESGDIAEFTRNADGTLTPVGDNDCIAEHGDEACDATDGYGLEEPVALTVSPNGDNVYVGDVDGDAVTTLTRNSVDGSLSEPNGDHDCIQDSDEDSDECYYSADGLSDVFGVAVSPDGDDVYTTGAPNAGADGSIAEFSVGEGGQLNWVGCLGTPEGDESCDGGSATGVVGITGLVVSPDGNNVYTASEEEGGPIAEFSRAGDGSLSQLSSPNNCIEEQDDDFGCDTSGTGIGDGFRLAISPDGANVYASAPSNPCFADGGCSDVAEFAREDDGSLSQLPSPDSCIQDESVEDGSECSGNESGTGLGGDGVAISPDGDNLYVIGVNAIAEFVRGTHALAVSLAGSGSGAVSDGTGNIACPSTCSHAYTANTLVTLTATPASGSSFAGWSGACSGIGTCQVRMSADMAVTATFTPSGPPAPGAPSPVITGAPTAVTDSGAGLSGSANPEGLPTTVYFEYGLDKRYSQVGASGPNYTAQTVSQQIGPDFTTHGVGPAAVSGLVPNALYHVRLVATNSAGTTFGQDATFKTALAPLPSAPTLGQTFNVAPVSGIVLIYIHGHLVPLTQLEQFGPGVTIDTLHGTLQLTINPGGGGPARDGAHATKVKTQTGQFGGAVFRLHQDKSGANKGLTTVMMAESAFKGAPSQAICTAPGTASDAHAAKLNTKVIQLLHASAHGKFATSGRYSAATVRGTIWDTIARCDGTLVHAIKDEVAVTDRIRHKTIILHAGQSYLAPGPGHK